MEAIDAKKVDDVQQTPPVGAPQAMNLRIALAILCLFVPAISVAGEPSVMFQSRWPMQGTNGYGPVDVACAPDGTLLVSDFFVVHQFTSNGALIGQWQPGPAGNVEHGMPELMAFGPGGGVYITTGAGNSVQKLTVDGELFAQWQLQPTPPNGSEPFGIAVGSDGSVFVSDVANNNIQKFTPDGTYLLRWGTTGTSPGQFSALSGLAADHAGHIFALDGGPACRVQVFDLNGNFLYQFGGYGSGAGQFEGMTDAAIDAADNLYISDNVMRRVQEFHSDGTFLGVVGSSGTGPGQFQSCLGIGADNAGNVYVADFVGLWVDRFGPAPVPAANATWGQVKSTYRK